MASILSRPQCVKDSANIPIDTYMTKLHRLNGIKGIILGMGSANERRGYYVMPFLIGHAHTQIEPRITAMMVKITLSL